MVIVRKVGFHQDGVINIYVGRKNSYKTVYGLDASILGNPFWMGDESLRNKCVDDYEKYFHSNLINRKGVKEALARLSTRSKNGENFALLCFCYPKRCHAETILKYLES